MTNDGLNNIVATKAAMNWGLSDKLQTAFPDIVGVERPKFELTQKIDPQWLAGFVAAEGCFYVSVTNSKPNSVVTLVFILTQDSRDEKLMLLIGEYLGCGHVYKNRTWINLLVSKFDDINLKIIPFFKKYKIKGVKALDFVDFCKVAVKVEQKKHLTAEGLEEIRKIKVGMNKGRKI